MTGREPAPVFVDAVRGHIRTGELVFCDVGKTLEVWAYGGATLTRREASDLGRALTAWACKRKAA